jgi:serine/threonine-protein kinase RsbW
MCDHKQPSPFHDQLSEPQTSGQFAHAALCTVEAARPFIQRLNAEMAALGYSHMDRFAVRYSLKEAIANAVKHGHEGDPTRAFQVSSLVTDRYVLTEVIDEGPGFDPALIVNPMMAGGGTVSGGRGIFLMRLFMTWIRYSHQGRRVTMCKMRSPLRLLTGIDREASAAKTNQ